MDEMKTENPNTTSIPTQAGAASGTESSKIKTRTGSGYLKQLYSTAKVTAGSTHSHLKNLTTFMVNLIPTEKVDASSLQVRVHFDDNDIQALSYSIKEHGVLQPILVVQKGDRYEVIAGERRLRAAKLANLERIPARIFQTNDKATHEIALRENLDRVDLHPLEEGEGYLSLLEAQHYTSHEAIAKAFGKPKSRITECIGYTRLPEETKWELLRVGIKSRSFLRQLFDIAPEKHLEKIAEVAAVEKKDYTPAIGAGSTSGTSAVDGTSDAAKSPRPKAAEKPFTFTVSDSRVMVPMFKWKAADGREKLQSYFDELKKISEQIEDVLTK